MFSQHAPAVFTVFVWNKGALSYPAWLMWLQENSLEHIYMQHQWENQHKQASFVLPWFVLRTPQRSACQAGMLQHGRNQFTFPGMIHHITPVLWTLLPKYPSLSHVICKQLCWEDYTAQNITVRCLPLMSVSFLDHSELLMTNNVLRWNHIFVLDNGEH